jgi:hypothetical protein
LNGQLTAVTPREARVESRDVVPLLKFANADLENNPVLNSQAWLAHSASVHRECDTGASAIVERSLAHGSDRDRERLAGSPAITHDYPSPEFMRLLVELGKLVEREGSHLRDQTDGMVRGKASPEEN